MRPTGQGDQSSRGLAPAALKREVPVATGEIDPAFAGAARVVEAEYEWRSNRMPAWGPPAPSSTRAPTVPLCGPTRRSPISRATGWRARSGCRRTSRRTRCTGSGSRARAPTGATTPAPRGSIRRYCRGRSAARCASRACAMRGTAGRHRRRQGGGRARAMAAASLAASRSQRRRVNSGGASHMPSAQVRWSRSSPRSRSTVAPARCRRANSPSRMIAG